MRSSSRPAPTAPSRAPRRSRGPASRAGRCSPRTSTSDARSVTDEPRYDGVGTLAIGILLVAIAVVLVVEMKSLLIGESASGEQQARILAEIEGTPRVSRVIHMRTLHLGPDELLVAAKVEFAPSLSTREVADTIDTIEGRVRGAVPIARVIYLEPDLLSEPSGAPEPAG